MKEAGLLGARRLREQLDRAGIRPRKELGQNFVIDPNTIRKVVDVAALTGAERVLEIGAGTGSLTLGLARSALHVTALELDRRLMGVLVENVGGLDNVDILQADAFEFDVASVDAGVLVANLPYSTATPIVLKVLETAPEIRVLTVMTQREAGERLAATPGSRVYGRSSVLVRYFGSATVAARVSRNAFWPVPGVDSVLVRIVRSQEPPDVAFENVAAIVKAGFSQRRKTLRNSLASLAGGTVAAERWMIGANLEPTARAEEIDVAGWIALARSAG